MDSIDELILAWENKLNSSSKLTYLEDYTRYVSFDPEKKEPQQILQNNWEPGHPYQRLLYHT